MVEVIPRCGMFIVEALCSNVAKVRNLILEIIPLQKFIV